MYYSHKTVQKIFNMKEMFLRACKLIFFTIPNIFSSLSGTIINESLNYLDQTNLQLIQGIVVYQKIIKKQYSA